LVSIDGTTIDVADTAANAGAFGRAGTRRGEGSAFPQLRLVALGECGTHAIFAAAMASYDTGEVSLAKQLVGALRPGMLCLADRGFTAHPLFSAAAASGRTFCGGPRATRSSRCSNGSPTASSAPSWSRPETSGRGSR